MEIIKKVREQNPTRRFFQKNLQGGILRRKVTTSGRKVTTSAWFIRRKDTTSAWYIGRKVPRWERKVPRWGWYLWRKVPRCKSGRIVASVAWWYKKENWWGREKDLSVLLHRNSKSFKNKNIKVLLENNQLFYWIPEMINHPQQKYIADPSMARSNTKKKK